MNWSFFSSGDIVLSLLTPLAVALLILILEKRGPLAPALQRTTGLVGPYFTSVAILFGLFTALLMNDVWRKDNAAWQSVQAEDDALRAILQLARANDIEAELAPQIKAYVAAASRENPYSKAAATARDDTDRAYEALLRQAIARPAPPCWRHLANCAASVTRGSSWPTTRRWGSNGCRSWCWAR